jgi:hypothetical protein
VHGFSIRSTTSFVYLRAGAGEPLLILEDGSEPSDPGDRLADITDRNAFRTQVYQRDGRFAVHMQELGWFGIDSDSSTITVPPNPYGAWMEPTIWGLPVALLVLSRGGLFLHASAVEIDGRAMVLTGPGHHGKTTLAAALAAGGCRPLSEDLVRCTVGRPTLLYPGPAVLRLRKDVARWLTVPGAHRVAEDAEKVHLALDPERRGTSDPLPLGGIILLYDAEATSIERLPPGATIRDLWVVSLNLPTPAGRAQCFRDITELAETVPVWRLARPLTRAALAGAVDLIIAAGRAS